MDDEEFGRKFDKIYRRKRRAEALIALVMSLGLLYYFFTYVLGKQ